MNIEIKDRVKMIKGMKVPRFYELVDNIIKPIDWLLIRLNDCGVWKGGGTPSKAKKKYWVNGNIPWASSQDITKGLMRSTTYKITELAIKESSANLMPTESIIMVMRSGILRHSFPVMKTNCEVAINQDLKSLIPNDDVYYDYIYYQLINNEHKILNDCVKTGTTVESIDFTSLKKIKILLPPKTEQQKIATILSTWDKAIELKEQLIESKKQQKKGLMKKLLTGEVRLPGIDGEWKDEKIGNILKERCETKHNSLELLAITGKNGIVKRTEVDIKDNSNEDKSKYKRICPLDIGYNTMRMWQGVSGVSEYEGIVSPAYTILAPTENIDSYFIGYLFKFSKMINIFWRHSQGMVNDTLNLKYSNLKNIKVKIPKEKSEQSEIAKVLMNIDKNIELIEVELSAIRIQKKGLMQLLLTGIIRVNL